jgi:hypothetical protein
VNQNLKIQTLVKVVLGYLQMHLNYTFVVVDDGLSDRTKFIISSGIHLTKTSGAKV